ncbi:MAG: hypothetical protein BIFFINMI_00937 [Phycisphaerae bacterium]|nr:hypothetical protein [Phycisphaerae bacterium]
MSDPLDVIWRSMETPAPVFGARQVRSWPRGALDCLAGSGLLVRAANASHITCPSCAGGHDAEVECRESRDGRMRFFIHCPESLRVEVPPDMLIQWAIDFDALARLVATGMALAGTCAPLIPGRLWRLGKTAWQGASREVLLARGLASPDGPAIAVRIGTGGRPIVLIGDQPPPPEIWPGRVPAVVTLSRVAVLGGAGIEVNPTHMMLLVKDADAASEALNPMPLAPKQKKLLVRRQLKAEIKSFLKDDDLIAAWRQHGSCRAAATALSEERGTRITKDMVNRAIQRRGGVRALAAADDSASVRRTVASQRRDRSGKILHRSQPAESE